MYNRWGKRAADLALTICALLLLSPFFLVLVIVIRFKQGSPIFFLQDRPGLHGRPFIVTKFRTMNERANDSGELLPDSDRLTKFGQFLRKTSLDELPELINVIRGDMSLVGPRPLLMRYLDLYSREQMRRHQVRPGITGWAQVNGRNAITWEEKFKFDVWYVDNLSFRLDLKILLLTFWKILSREGISQPGQATAEQFMGTNSVHQNKK